MYKFSLFLAAALFGSSLAFWPFSSNGGDDSRERGNGGRFPPPPPPPNSGEFEIDGRGRGHGGNFPRPPAPTFLKEVDQAERREWFEIEHNRNATKAEIQAAQDQWAANQTSEVQQLYNEYKEDKLEFIMNITAKADEIAANFSQEAQNIYNQIKGIIQNQDISKAEECEQIREVLSNVTKEIRRELKPLKKMLGKKCCDHKQRGPGGPFGGPFGGPHGPFGNGGFFGGIFGGPRRGSDSGSNSDENFDGPRRGGDRRGSGSNSNSNSNSNEDSDEDRPRPSRRPRPTGSPRPTGFPGFPTNAPIDGSTNGQFPTLQPSSTTPGGFFRNLFRF